VALDIVTAPAQARLIDASDGHFLGLTPWHQELPSRAGKLEIRLEKKGYEPRTISVPLDKKFDGNFALERARGGSGHTDEPSGEHIIKL
jgi:hypothetical protein